MNDNSHPSLTRVEELAQHIRLLASVEPTDAPFLSAFLDLRNGAPACIGLVRQRVAALKAHLSAVDRSDLEQALGMVEERLALGFGTGVKGAALFARATAGGRFFSCLEFALPLENHVTVYPTPVILPLLELKDSCRRYLLVLVRYGSLAVTEVDLGTASMRAWVDNTRLRRSDDELLYELGSSPLQGTSRSRLASQANLVASLARKAGRIPVVLAGDQRMVEGMRYLLPKPLRGRMLALPPMAPNQSGEVVMQAATKTLGEHRKRQAQELVARLSRGRDEIRTAVYGGRASLECIREGRADTVIIAKDYRSSKGRVCSDCGESRFQDLELSVCPECARGTIKTIDLQSELARAAAQQGTLVAVVDSEELGRLGGVVSLLTDRAASATSHTVAAHSELELVA